MNEAQDVVSLYGPAVWRTICRLLGGQEGAADCFQDTFVQFARLQSMREIEFPLALLKRIATGRAIDEVRKRSVRRRREQPLSDGQTTGAAEPWEAMATDELAAGLLEALREIPPDQATVFCMTQLDEVDRTQVAAAMGIGIGHVSVLLHRARTNLQSRLAKYLPATRNQS